MSLFCIYVTCPKGMYKKCKKINKTFPEDFWREFSHGYYLLFEHARTTTFKLQNYKIIHSASNSKPKNIFVGEIVVPKKSQ